MVHFFTQSLRPLYGEWNIGGPDGNKKPVLQLEGYNGGGLD